jgi:hypothetical protein
MSKLTYAEMRREEVTREYLASSYDILRLSERGLVDYCVELEERLAEATGADMQAEWFSRLIGDRT